MRHRLEALVRTRGTLVFLMGSIGIRDDLRGTACSRDEEGYAGCAALKGYDSGTEADRGDGVDSAGGGRTSGRGHTGNHSGRRGMCTCGYLSWVDRLSLGGVRVLLTRPRELSGTTAQKLRKCGAEVIELPAIRTKARENNTALQQALTDISDYAWIVFTSPTGVRVFLRSCSVSVLMSGDFQE